MYVLLQVGVLDEILAQNREVELERLRVGSLALEDVRLLQVLGDTLVAELLGLMDEPAVREAVAVCRAGVCRRGGWPLPGSAETKDRLNAKTDE